MPSAKKTAAAIRARNAAKKKNTPLPKGVPSKKPRGPYKPVVGPPLDRMKKK